MQSVLEVSERPKVVSAKRDMAQADKTGARANFRTLARPWRHPISRWYVVPLARSLAARAAASRLSPGHLTAAGAAAAAVAATILIWHASWSPLAAVFVGMAWFFDRADGALARAKGVSSKRGAWIDANADELVDLVLHGAVAYAATVSLVASGAVSLPWLLFAAFLGGKYLLFYSVTSQEQLSDRIGKRTSVAKDSQHEQPQSVIQRLYHLPGNADVRVHLLIVALLSGWLTAELALVAVYFNLRWIARWALVPRRLEGSTA